MKEIISKLLANLSDSKKSNILLTILAITLAAYLAFSSASCSVYTSSVFHVDSANVSNMDKVDSTKISINPLKIK